MKHMKKRILALCLMLAMIPVLTGCIRLETTMKVNSNGTADVSTLFAVSSEIMSMGDSEEPVGLSEDEIEEYKAKGFVYEPYSDEKSGYVGYTLTKKGVDIKSAKSEGEGLETMMSGDILKVNGDRVTIDFAPLSEDEYEESSAIFEQMGSMGGYMRFTLKVPGKVISHNATSVSKDGKTLTWDLTKMKANERVHAEFTLKSGSVLVWLIPVIVGVLAVAAAAVIIIRKKKAAAVPEPVENVGETAQETAQEAREIVPEEQRSSIDSE